jgi:hypothetical protein
LNRFEVDEPGDRIVRSPEENVDPGDRLLRSSPDKTTDPGDASLLQANPNKLESLETLVDTETIKVDVDSAADKEIKDEEDAANTELRRSSRAHRPNTRYMAYTATKGIIIPKSYEAAVSDQHHCAE